MIPDVHCDECLIIKKKFCNTCGIENPDQKHTDKCIMKHPATARHDAFCVGCAKKIVYFGTFCDICYCVRINHVQNICGVKENHPECYVEIVQ